MWKAKVMQDNSEIICYNKEGIPLYMKKGCLSHCWNMEISCHWHEDIELVHVRKGQFYYYVNGTRRLLKEKDSLVVNSRQMHYAHSVHKEDCAFSSVLFHPSLFTQNKILQKLYIESVLKNPKREYVHCTVETAVGKKIHEILTALEEIGETEEPAYELEAIGYIHILWGYLVRTSRTLRQAEAEQIKNVEEVNIQKEMVSYIYEHYGEKITLKDIAAAGHVSRNKCCEMFRHYIGQSPVDFLNSYRLRKGGSLLEGTQKTVAEIAFLCGFNHLSYFAKQFAKLYGCTPREYRRRAGMAESLEDSSFM